MCAVRSSIAVVFQESDWCTVQLPCLTSVFVTQPCSNNTLTTRNWQRLQRQGSPAFAGVIITTVQTRPSVRQQVEQVFEANLPAHSNPTAVQSQATNKKRCIVVYCRRRFYADLPAHATPQKEQSHRQSPTNTKSLFAKSRGGHSTSTQLAVTKAAENKQQAQNC